MFISIHIPISRMYIYIYMSQICYVYISKGVCASRRKVAALVAQSVFVFSNHKRNKLSVSNPKSKYVVYLSVLSQISSCQSLGRKNKHDILKTNRKVRTTRRVRSERVDPGPNKDWAAPLVSRHLSNAASFVLCVSRRVKDTIICYVIRHV